MQSRIVAQIVVPCLNEESAIPAFFAEIEQLRKNSNSIELRFVFVDNDSTDRSYDLLNAHCQRHPQDQLITCNDTGYGAALKAGFKHSTSALVGFVDLDGTYPLLSFFDLYKKMAGQENIEIVIANRMTGRSQMPFLRALGNNLYKFMIRLVYGQSLNDACSGMRLFKSNLLTDILNLKNNGLGFSIELTCHMLIQNWTYAYSNINYLERTGRSKLNIISDGFEFLKLIFETKNRTYEKQ